MPIGRRALAGDHTGAPLQIANTLFNTALRGIGPWRRPCHMLCMLLFRRFQD